MQMNILNPAVGEVTWLLYTEVTVAHVLCMGYLWVSLDILALNLVGLAVVVTSRQFESALAWVFRRTTAQSSASFAEAKLTLLRRGASAADAGKHGVPNDNWARPVVEVEESMSVKVGGLRWVRGESSEEESSKKSPAAVPRMEMQIQGGIHISDPAVRNWCIFRQVNFGIRSIGSIVSVSRSSSYGGYLLSAGGNSGRLRQCVAAERVDEREAWEFQLCSIRRDVGREGYARAI